MPRPTCDPSTWGDPDIEVTRVEGPVRVSIHYQWDGTSTPPNCDGPLLYVEVVNASLDVSAWAWFFGRNRKSWLSVEIPPLTGVPTPLRLVRQQLHPRGFDNRSDTDGIILSDSDQPPTQTV